MSSRVFVSGALLIFGGVFFSALAESWDVAGGIAAANVMASIGSALVTLSIWSLVFRAGRRAMSKIKGEIKDE